MRKRAADLFCGAGGTTTGAKMSGEVDVVFALNHWDRAIETHSANNRETKHVNSRLDQTSPGECPKIDFLYASPECTHHSKARGGKPTSDQQRSGSWDVLKWIEYHRPSHVIIENVWEITNWGPVGKDGKPLEKFNGKYFQSWVSAIQSGGYKVDYRKLNAADFGAATSRERFILVARKGNRSPLWPEPSHSRQCGGELPGMGLQRWRAAAEVIDWTLPCPSIFGRTRELADKTLARIEAGLRRFVQPYIVKFRANEHSESIARPISTITAGGGHHGLAMPYITQWDHQGSSGPCVRSIDSPLATMTTKANMGLTVPYMVPHFGEREGQQPRSHGIDQPTPTITGQGAGSIAVPYLFDVNHGDAGHCNGRSSDISDPLGTVTSKRGKGLVIPWLSSFYGTDNHHGADEPVATITTKDRHAVCVARYSGPDQWPAPRTEAMRSLQATMRELGIADVGFRMLQNHELSAAQSFPSDYVFAGNKSEVTKQIGNSVPPLLAKAVTLACCG